MRRAKAEGSPQPLKPRRPALTVEAREGQLVSLAMDVAEQRLLAGTASSQEVVHFLRLGSVRERLERERLETENQMLKAKITAIESQASSEEKYRAAIRAFSRYSGHDDEDEEEDDYDE